MIVVDSNTWADYFNGADEPHVDRLESALENEEDVAVIPVILTEVLQGFKSDHGFRTARRRLLALPVIEPSVNCHIRAAALYRRLRRRGVTVRGAVDCIIAQVCLDTRAQLLSPDRDFHSIAEQTGLELWRPDG